MNENGEHLVVYLPQEKSLNSFLSSAAFAGLFDQSAL